MAYVSCSLLIIRSTLRPQFLLLNARVLTQHFKSTSLFVLIFFLIILAPFSFPNYRTSLLNLITIHKSEANEPATI